eukprot:c2341_g1_i2.p1 GENE.c2341_g1_i2~~c2341_g1_i2.p1  ORF type:complete len:335 (+),score=34.35 c2341_g1_i2:41-1045(+)
MARAGHALETPRQTDIYSTAISADGSLIFSGNVDGVIHMFDARTFTLLETIEGHTRPVTRIEVASDNTRFISASLDGLTRVWELPQNISRRVYFGHQEGVVSMCVKWDLGILATGSRDCSAKTWSLNSPNALRTFGHPNDVEAVQLNNSATRLFCSCHRAIHVWDTQNGVPLQLFVGHDGVIRGLALASDESFLVSASFDRSVRVWDPETGQQLRCFDRDGTWLTSFALSADDRFAITGSLDGEITEWSLKSGIVHSFKGHSGWITGVSVCRSGTRFVTGDKNRTLFCWQTSDGVFAQRLRTFLLGTHQRVGSRSFLRLLPTDIVGLIAEQVRL